ncbi:hypothetical protein Lalb_Chr03g0026401 [Lupinus albus]|uniref:Uncharacterized protein n=1 Tax=Lupinus albus TaxID=3870 RepID=A0A6A4QPC7_LUPAL|nr:hypothetical protein Lalb_Chr03g0026401 [Lupinus albus]
MMMTMIMTKPHNHDKIKNKPKCCNCKHEHTIHLVISMENSSNCFINQNTRYHPN